jgi:hypothetical protein
VTAAAGLVTCDCCQTPRPAAEVQALPWRRPLPRRCRLPAAHGLTWATRSARRPSAGPPRSPVPAALCGATDPAGGAFERSPGVYACLDRAGCDARGIETQYLAAHGDDSQVLYTSAQMRAAAAGSVAQVPEAVPADVAEARQAAARADLEYGFAAAARRR